MKVEDVSGTPCEPKDGLKVELIFDGVSYRGKGIVAAVDKGEMVQVVVGCSGKDMKALLAMLMDSIGKVDSSYVDGAYTAYLMQKMGRMAKKG